MSKTNNTFEKDNFVVLTQDNQDECISKIVVPTTKTVFELRCDQGSDNLKRIWIKLESAEVKYGFTVNTFKENAEDGHLTVDLSPEDKETIDKIDTHVYNYIKQDSRFSVVDSLKMTPKTWDRVFRKSLYDGSLRATVNKSSVAFFDENKRVLSSEMGWGNVSEGTKISLICEPCFVWFMNAKAGISWNVRQVRFLEPIGSEERGATWVMGFDEEEDD